MQRKIADAQVVRIDDATKIIRLFDGKDFGFSVVIGELAGDHPKVINHESDRAYFVLEGSVDVFVDGTIYHAAKHDLVTVPREAIHGLSGTAKYLIINSPSFNPSTEEPVD